MSNELAALFPAGAITAELRAAGDVSSLMAAEAKCIEGAVRRRAEDFAGGRACARRALAHFGAGECAIPAAPDRQPAWPSGFTGSITHTEGFCAAVVGRREMFRSLGIDSEVVGAVRAPLWRTLFGAEELAWLGALSQAEQAAAATLLFSAKEAYYKCRYPVTGEKLNFHDVRISAPDWGSAAGEFEAHLLARPDAPGAAGPRGGRYLRHGALLSTGIAWLAAQ